MSAQDMRDMLGLTGNVPRPAKKRKLVEKRPLEKGMAREVSALMGERAPPVSMIAIQPKYKQRPRRLQKVTPWTWAPFRNEARRDELQLRHWQKRHTPKVDESKPEGEEPPQEIKMEQKEEKPYQFTKYDVQIDAPTYSDETYEAKLQDDDWSKEETDYLVDIVKDYGQKWAVIWDRYDYVPSKTEESEESITPQSRNMEDLKARYYSVRGKMLAHETPIASMNSAQYNLYQTLTHFNVKQEHCRKKMTEAHLYRSEAEVQEETALLAELQRIMVNQTQLETARKELRERLEAPASGASSTQYTTSAALGQLFQQLFAADRSKKDRRLKDLPHVQTGSNPSHRDSMSGLVTGGLKSSRPRDSLASAASLDGGMPDSRTRALSPHTRERYFITMHDKLSSGVSFASDKLSKPRLAKSSVQTERIAAVLQQLKVPEVIPLPTQKVVEAFDGLMGRVGTLLEMRKLAEKEEGEIRVREAEKGIRRDESEESKGVKRSASVLSEGEQGREKRRK